MRVFVPALLVALCGCEDFAALAQLKPRRLVVHVHDLHHLDGGTLSVPMPATSSPLEVWVRPDAGTDWVHVTGTWMADGEAELYAPRGFTLLQRPDFDGLTQVEGDDIDLGFELPGPPRADAPSETFLTLQLRGADVVTPTNTAVSLWLPASGIGYSGVNPTFFDPEPAPIFEAPGSFRVTFPWNRRPLVQQNDGLMAFTADAVSTDGGVKRYTVSRRAIGQVEVVAGRAIIADPMVLTQLPAASQPVPGFSYDFRPLQSRIIDPVLNGVVLGASIEVGASIGNPIAPLPLQLTTATELIDLVSPPVTVEPLLGPPWEPRVAIKVAYVSVIDLVGGSSRFIPLEMSFASGFSTFNLTDDSIATPVTDIEVFENGARVEGTELHTFTPTVTWAATNPRINRFYVIPLEVRFDPDGLRASAPLIVNRPVAVIPPGLLQPDTRYVFVIISDNCGASPASAPFRDRLQSTCADASARSLMFSTPVR